MHTVVYFHEEVCVYGLINRLHIESILLLLLYMLNETMKSFNPLVN